MDVYFIRHGETAANRSHRHQSDTEPLTLLGKTQARAAAKRIVKCTPTHLITSTMTRAQQSAAELASELSLAPEPSVLFVELQRPSHLIGLHHFSPRSVWYMLRWFFSHDEAYWERVGGESRLGFLLRLREAKYYLETLPRDAKIVVVSHAVFISFFVEHVCNEKPIPFWKAALLLLKINALENSSITQVHYDPTRSDGTCKWNVLRYEDDAHVVT